MRSRKTTRSQRRHKSQKKKKGWLSATGLMVVKEAAGFVDLSLREGAKIGDAAIDASLCQHSGGSKSVGQSKSAKLLRKH